MVTGHQVAGVGDVRAEAGEVVLEVVGAHQLAAHVSADHDTDRPHPNLLEHGPAQGRELWKAVSPRQHIGEQLVELEMPGGHDGRELHVAWLRDGLGRHRRPVWQTPPFPMAPPAAGTVAPVHAPRNGPSPWP